MKNAIVTCERTRGIIRSSYSFLNFFEERAAKPPGLSHASALGWSVMDVNVDEVCCVQGCLSLINAILKNCSRAVSRNRCFTAVRRRCEKSVCAWDTADYVLWWCMVGGCDRGCLSWCHFKQLHRMFYGTFLQQWDRRFVSGCGNNGWRMQISKLFTVWECTS